MSHVPSFFAADLPRRQAAKQVGWGKEKEEKKKEEKNRKRKRKKHLNHQVLAMAAFVYRSWMKLFAAAVVWFAVYPATSILLEP